MGKLDGEVSLTRSELEKAVGAEWALADPSCAPLLRITEIPHCRSPKPRS